MRPFGDGDSYSTFTSHRKKLVQEIQSLDNEYVLNVSAVELENHYLDKGRINPLVLYADQYYIEAQEPTQIDVSHDFRRGVFPGERAIVQGTLLVVVIPFQGVLYCGEFDHRHTALVDIRISTSEATMSTSNFHSQTILLILIN